MIVNVHISRVIGGAESDPQWFFGYVSYREAMERKQKDIVPCGVELFAQATIVMAARSKIMQGLIHKSERLKCIDLRMDFVKK